MPCNLTLPSSICLSPQPRNRASYTTHISTCAFNSLFAGELVIPDWVGACLSVLFCPDDFIVCTALHTAHAMPRKHCSQ